MPQLQTLLAATLPLGVVAEVTVLVNGYELTRSVGYFFQRARLACGCILRSHLTTNQKLAIALVENRRVRRETERRLWCDRERGLALGTARRERVAGVPKRRLSLL